MPTAYMLTGFLGYHPCCRSFREIDTVSDWITQAASPDTPSTQDWRSACTTSPGGIAHHLFVVAFVHRSAACVSARYSLRIDE